ncbi:MAG: DUF480 domain-containing protein [Planctomycetota bacterium]
MGFAMQETSTSTPDSELQPRWQPLSRIQRRVVGVLVEKAKTTPDQYPLSLYALTNGCNQKSNRSPQMNLSADDVEQALESLRSLGAVSEVHGDGRVVRYRHYLKDWLGVDGTELAVMTELLLRGEQTVGELRGRAARMAAGQLGDMQALKPVLQSLIGKQLVVELTPSGRGQVITHALYQPEELQRLKQKSHGGGTTSSSPPPPTTPPAVGNSSGERATGNERGTDSGEAASSELAAIRAELAALTDQVARMTKEIEDIWSNLGS